MLWSFGIAVFFAHDREGTPALKVWTVSRAWEELLEGRKQAAVKWNVSVSTKFYSEDYLEL